MYEPVLIVITSAPFVWSELTPGGRHAFFNRFLPNPSSLKRNERRALCQMRKYVKSPDQTESQYSVDELIKGSFWRQNYELSI